MREIPKIGKTYDCFDDGKISENRRYKITVTEIIPFNKADKYILKLWNKEGLSCPWLFKETDFFIKANSTEYSEEPVAVFARTLNGEWFGLGNWWNSGQLDIDGSLLSSIVTQD